MFRRICTLLGACAFLMIASSQDPLSAQSRQSGAEQPDQTFWLTIKDTSLPDLFEMFIKRYPKSAHRSEAQRKLKALQNADQPSAMDQAKQLMKKAPERASVARATAPAAKAPATRAPALAAPVLAPAPSLATAPALAPALAPSATMTPSAAVAPSAALAPAATVVAPAPAPVTAPDVTQPAVAQLPDEATDDQSVEEVSMETVILIQHHLNRVGCTVGNLDGKWGAKSQKSAGRFAKTINQPLVTHSPNSELLTTLKDSEDDICAPVYKAKPRVKKYQRARTRPTIRKSKKTKLRKKYSKKKVIATRKPKKVRHKKKAKKKTAKIKVATKSKKTRKAKKVKKVYVVKRKKKNNTVSGDPFSDAVRAVGASSSGGGSGGGGGW